MKARIKIYVVFDENKQPGFYTDDIYAPDQIPKEAKEISEELYREFLANQGIKTINPETLQIELIKKTPQQIRSELEFLIKNKKKSIAYGGFYFERDGKPYIASTKEEDIGKTSSRVGKIQRKNLESTTWTCFSVHEQKLVELSFSGQEFIDLADDADDFINDQFAKQTQLLAELESKSDEELTDEYVNDLKSRIEIW